MRMTIHALTTSLALLAASPALAQDAPAEPLTFSGSVALVSDYRFRGISQTDRAMAIQGGITANHESGLYAGAWGSNLAGWGQFGGSNMELDLFGGFKLPVGDGGTLDVGLIWYMYPSGSDITDFAEPYVKLSGTAGPVTLTAGVAYAPKQEALGNWFNHPDSVEGDKEDNLYVSGDAAAAIPSTPFTLKAHIGYSDGNPGLGPNGTSVAPTGTYFDWSLGLDTTYKGVTLGVSYVDTDIGFNSNASQILQPNFSKGNDGTGSIANGTILFSASAAF